MSYDDNRLPPGGSTPTLSCSDDVSPQTLSAWRDGLLPPDQAAWLARHAGACPACRARLADYDAASSALANQPIPYSRADLWPEVRAAIARESPRLRLPRGVAWGGVGAGVAVLLLVSLFAGLLYSHLSGRGTTTIAHPTATTGATPTTTLAPTATTSGSNAWTTVTGCGGVPDALRVRYESGASNAPLLGRSDDCGATWTTLTPPTIPGVDLSNGSAQMWVTSSPLSVNAAFLHVQVSSDPTACAPLASASPASRSAQVQTLAALSSNPCQIDFVTDDGGQSWKKLTYPVQGWLGVAPAEGDQQQVRADYIRAQGSRLYGIVTTYIVMGGGIIPPGRLVASDDGGATWHVSDTALAAKGLGIWDYTVTPTGSAIYVTAEPFNDPARQPPSYGATLTTWVSFDGGQTWTQKNNPAAVTGQNSVVAMQAGVSAGSQRAVYELVGAKSGVELDVSLDDGHSWGTSTTLNAAGLNGSTFLAGTLADGSVIVVTLDQPVMDWWPQRAPTVAALRPPVSELYDVVLAQSGSSTSIWVYGFLNGDANTIVTTQLQLT